MIVARLRDCKKGDFDIRGLAIKHEAGHAFSGECRARCLSIDKPSGVLIAIRVERRKKERLIFLLNADAESADLSSICNE